MPCNAAFDEDGFHLSRCSVKEEKGGKGTLGWDFSGQNTNKKSVKSPRSVPG